MVHPNKPSRFMQGRDNNMRRDRDRRNERGGKNDRPGRRPDGDDKEAVEKKEVKVEKVEKPEGTEQEVEDKGVPAEVPTKDKKFSGRCRLFVGNLVTDMTEKEFKEMFEEFGESSEVFLNAPRGFGFIRMDTRKNAETAKNALDGIMKRGRHLRVRFAAHTAAIRVKHLHPFVSNELLTEGFSIFGDIERAIVCIDDKGKPNGEGIVEFARKPGAQAALNRVNDGVFLLGSSPRPVSCELVEHKDEEDGLPEIFMNKNQDFHKERDGPPRFASPGSFEFNFSMKWKELYAQHERKKADLQMEFDDAVSKMEMDESSALMEHQTQLMREDLRRRQEELRRMEEQHQIEMQRKLDLRRNQDDAKRQMDEERRREDEARMYMQQELAMRQMQADERHRNYQGGGGGGSRGGPGGNMGGSAPPMQPPPAPPAGLSGPGGHNAGGPPGHRVRNNDISMGNRGMNQQGPSGMQSGGMGMQGPGNMNPQQMQNMRGRKSDADYRQSRFDQPPQHFQMNPQQQPHQQQQQQQQQQQAQQQMGNQQMNMMQGGQMMGMPGGNMGNGGGGPPPNQGRGQLMHEGPRGKHANSEGSDGGQGEYFEKKRSRRF